MDIALFIFGYVICIVYDLKYIHMHKCNIVLFYIRAANSNQILSNLPCKYFFTTFTTVAVLRYYEFSLLNCSPYKTVSLFNLYPQDSNG